MTKLREVYTEPGSPWFAESVVLSVSSIGITIADDLSLLEIGSRVEIDKPAGVLLAEIVSLSDGSALALPFGDVHGVRRGACVRLCKGGGTVAVSQAWLGRVVDGLGRPIDGKGPIRAGGASTAIRGHPPTAPQRARLGPRVSFGIKSLDMFTPAKRGQRLGIFSASGVGKSALLAMTARNMDCDIKVIALIGERGREVRDFIEDHIGEEGLKRAVVIVATADEPALIRREAGYLALAVAEHFRDACPSAHVLCLFDSLTRIAMAQREIGLAAGEPPATKGYTPSVFSLLPSLIERAGPGWDKPDAGSITGIFSVLVDGDDHDEPIADAARSMLDGHIVLDRRIAEQGRFPAVNIVRSVSRTAQSAMPADMHQLAVEARKLAADYEQMHDMIRIGAYRRGSDPTTDRAIDLYPELENYLSQAIDEEVSVEDAASALEKLMALKRSSESIGS